MNALPESCSDSSKLRDAFIRMWCSPCLPHPHYSFAVCLGYNYTVTVLGYGPLCEAHVTSLQSSVTFLRCQPLIYLSALVKLLLWWRILSSDLLPCCTSTVVYYLTGRSLCRRNTCACRWACNVKSRCPHLDEWGQANEVPLGGVDPHGPLHLPRGPQVRRQHQLPGDHLALRLGAELLHLEVHLKDLQQFAARPEDHNYIQAFSKTLWSKVACTVVQIDIVCNDQSSYWHRDQGVECD